jgi:hypothetical protein
MNTRILVVAVVSVWAASSVAYADLTKDQCVDAHSRGQDAKEQGHLSLARKLFLQCAQSSCPSIVQGDCARFADELNRLQPSVTLAARDGNGADLPDTTVYIDDVLVATRLDDGRPHDIDPGKHTFKFSNGGHDEVVTVVIGTGEQGRAVTATFGPATPPKAVAGADSSLRAAATPPEPHMVHPLAPKVVMYGGAALGVLGFAFASFELTRIPSQCSLGDHVCNATPGDQVYNDAHHAVELSNVGWIVGGVGAAAFVGGLVWYIKTGHMEGQEGATEHVSVAPWFSGAGGGLEISGPLR